MRHTLRSRRRSEVPIRPLVPRRALLAVTLTALCVLAVVPAARAHHVAIQGASVTATVLRPAADGSASVRLRWSIRCTNAISYGAVVMIYSYARRGPVFVDGFAGIGLATGTMVTDEALRPGRYRPQLVGAGCGGTGDPSIRHAARIERAIDGPDFEICGPPGAARTAAAGAGWPVIPISGDCMPACRAGASASAGWPVVPARERCGSVTVQRNTVPLPIRCPGGASASVRGWPVLPARGRCAGSVRLETQNRVRCAGASAAGWPVLPVARCSTVRRARIALGSARFRLGAGRAGIVPVKLSRNGRRAMKALRRAPVRATITLRKGKKQARTVRTFVLRGS